MNSVADLEKHANKPRLILRSEKNCKTILNGFTQVNNFQEMPSNRFFSYLGDWIWAIVVRFNM